MGKNNKMMKNRISIFISGILLTSFAHAQVVVQNAQIKDQTTLPPLTVLQADAATLRANKCDPSVMYSLNNTYLMKRSLARNLELNTLVREQVDLTPPPPKPGAGIGAGGSCFEQAANNINSVVNTYNNIVSILSGSINPGPLIQKAGSLLANAACQQVNSYTGNLTGGIANGINGNVNGVTNGINNTVNGFQLGSGNVSVTGGQVTGGGLNVTGYNGASTPFTNGSQIQGTITSGIGASTSTLGGAISSPSCSFSNITGCNPFK